MKEGKLAWTFGDDQVWRAADGVYRFELVSTGDGGWQLRYFKGDRLFNSWPGQLGEVVAKAESLVHGPDDIAWGVMTDDEREDAAALEAMKRDFAAINGGPPNAEQLAALAGAVQFQRRAEDRMKSEGGGQ